MKRLRVFGFTLAAAMIIYSSLQLIEPQVTAAGTTCCVTSSDCIKGLPCTQCTNSCGVEHGFCGNSHCIP